MEAAHATALSLKDDYGIKEVLGVESANGHPSFKLKDLNNTWWEISTVSQADFDAIFAKGDAAH